MPQRSSKYLADVKQVSEYDTELAGKLESDIQETVIKKLKAIYVE